jgi:two-component system response regulator HydG
VTVQKRVLIVDDEVSVCDVISRLLERDGVDVVQAYSAAEAIQLLDQERLDCVITDVRMPGGSGIEVLDHARLHLPNLPVIILTAQASLQAAVDAVNKGAYYFLRKPFSGEEVRAVVAAAVEMHRTREENRHLRHELRRATPQRRIIGRSDAMQAVLKIADKVAGSDCTVLISGESGTGKELFARHIHRNSRRGERRFVSINCGALPESLLESELFGHMKGAFTGAHRNNDGLFRVAHEGTLFLDEIGEMSPGIQVKLLRALQEREVMPVGGARPVAVDVRVLAATNRNLEDDVREGKFRADLYYRLNVVPLHVPPLRERPDDIPLLVEHFLRKACASEGVPCKHFDVEAAQLLKQHAWPGNVRELENIIERAVILVDAAEISPDALPPAVVRGSSSPSTEKLMEGTPTLEALERRYITKILDESNWRKKRASQILGIDASTLYRKIQRYHLSKGGERGQPLLASSHS